MSTLTIFSQQNAGISSQCSKARKEIKSIKIRKEEIKLSPFVDDMLGSEKIPSKLFQKKRKKKNQRKNLGVI